MANKIDGFDSRPVRTGGDRPVERADLRARTEQAGAANPYLPVDHAMPTPIGEPTTFRYAEQGRIASMPPRRQPLFTSVAQNGRFGRFT